MTSEGDMLDLLDELFCVFERNRMYPPEHKNQSVDTEKGSPHVKNPRATQENPQASDMPISSQGTEPT